MPDRVLLGENHALYRFLEPNYGGPLAGFWLPVETYHYLRRLRECSGIRLPAWAVSARAMLPADAATFCIATLLVKLYGFRGRARVRDTAPTPLTRIWLPSLTPDQIHLRSYRL